MEIMELTESLSDVCGVADLNLERDKLIFTYGEDILIYPYAIVIGHKMNPEIIEKIPLTYSNDQYAQEYLNEYSDSFKRASDIAEKIVKLINEKGYEALILDGSGTNPKLNLKRNFSNKASASIAGLGWIGKNAMLINEKYGPRLTWCTILTNAPLSEYTGNYMDSLCGDCTYCVKACPGKAIIDNPNPQISYDPEKCGAHLQHMATTGHLMACGMCLYICPFGNEKTRKLMEEKSK